MPKNRRNVKKRYKRRKSPKLNKQQRRLREISKATAVGRVDNVLAKDLVDSNNITSTSSGKDTNRALTLDRHALPIEFIQKDLAKTMLFALVAGLFLLGVRTAVNTGHINLETLGALILRQ